MVDTNVISTVFATLVIARSYTQLATCYTQMLLIAYSFRHLEARTISDCTIIWMHPTSNSFITKAGF